MRTAVATFRSAFLQPLQAEVRKPASLSFIAAERAAAVEAETGQGPRRQEVHRLVSCSRAWTRGKNRMRLGSLL